MEREQEAKLAEQANHLPELFADRLPASDMDDLRSMAGGGEWGLMLDDHLASLRMRQTPMPRQRQKAQAAHLAYRQRCQGSDAP